MRPSRFAILTLFAAVAACESNAPGSGIDACEQIATFKVDSTTTTRIESTDCNAGGFLTDLFSFTLTSQTAVSVRMQSDSFDTYLELFRQDREFVAVNDDSAVGAAANSYIDAVLPAGTYLIAASTFIAGVRGPYSLTTALRTGGLTTCNPVWVRRGVTIADSITGTDCPQTGGFRADRALIAVAGGSTARMNQRSTALDAKLEIWNFSQATLLTANDDSSGTTNDAWIAYNPGNDGALLVVAIGTSTAGETGAYTFEVSTATTAASAAAAPPARGKGLPPRAAPR